MIFFKISRLSLLPFLLLAGIFLAGCGTSKKAENRSLRTRSSDYLLEQMVKKQVDAEWFEGKAKLGYSSDYMTMGASATIRMRKDSILWLSIKKLGFEAVRVLITQDSVYVLDRLNNQYAIENFKWLEDQFNLPADLRTMQMIFLGNPVFFSAKPLESEVEESTYRLSHQNEHMESNYWLDGRELQLRKMSFNDQRYGRSFDYELGSYQPAPDKQIFSYFRNIAINSQETGKANLEIKFSEIELNVPKNIRFEIPKKYTRVELE